MKNCRVHPTHWLISTQVMTYNLDSHLPMITVHPHWNASVYFRAKGLPWAQKKNAVAAFVSNCRNAGAE